MYAQGLASQLKSELGNGVHVVFGELPQSQVTFQSLDHPMRDSVSYRL